MTYLCGITSAHMLRDCLDIFPTVSLNGLDKKSVFLRSPIPRLSRPVLVVRRPLAFQCSKLCAKPFDLRPSTLQFILQLHNAPLLLHE